MTSLHPTKEGVTMLKLQGVTVTDLDEVESWLFAIDMLPVERRKACKQILTEGYFFVCNIENKVEIRCMSRY